MVLRKELTTIYESLIPDLNDKILKYGLDDDRNPFRAHGGSIKPDRLIYDNGAVMYFRGLDKPEKRLGPTLDVVYVNQAEQISMEAYNKLWGRLRNNKQVINGQAYHQIILDINPLSKTNWEKAYADERGIPMFKFWLDDNPLWYCHNKEEWSKEGQEYHDRLSKYTGHEYVRGFLGDYGAAEGLVYKHFNEAAHVKNVNWSDIGSDWTIISSYDFGTTISSPFCLLVFAVSPDGNQMVQLPQTQIYLAEIERIAEKIHTVENRIQENLGRGVNLRISDHEGTARQILSEHGLSSNPAKKKILEGIEKVKEFFDPNIDKSIILQQKPRDLAFDPDPKLIGKPQRLLDELLEYSYRSPEDQEKNPDKADHPIKRNDHAMDALRYLVMEFKEMPEVTEIEVMTMPEQDIFSMDFGGLL